jgi:CopA family copper-resistance protein
MSHSRSSAPRLSRRRFVQGLAGGALLLSSARNFSWGAEDRSRSALVGPNFDLTLTETPVNFTGRPRVATAVNAQVPGPLLRMRQGDVVTIRVTNRMRARSSIHWHGFILPADMDGVPGLSFPGIPAGETFTYRFKVNQSGTYWYHAHSGFQEQTGLYGPIVIERAAGERHASDREHVVLISDWTDEDPERIYAKLKKQSDYYNYHKRTVRDFFADARARGVKETLADRRMWGEMRMDPTDLADVNGTTYTYLMNGFTPSGNWTGLFRRGERVRLRLINGSSMSFFDVRIPGLKLTVVAADGQDVEPVTVDELRIGTAEVFDVIVEPKDDRAYTLFAQAMDRSGYARGTLAPRPGMTADVPPLDAPQLLTMSDMGMAHAGHGAMSGMGAARAGREAMSDAGAAHAGHEAMSGAGSARTSHGAVAGTDHAARTATLASADQSATSHQHAGAQHAASKASAHAPAHFGPTVDSVAAQTSSRLDDPGPGLRNNGRRVLTYADLHTLGGPIDRRGAGREIDLHLTGHMERYIWSFNGRKFSEAEPLRFNHGERLRIVLVNDSMMTHPIHLHGMWSELEAEDGSFLVRKHTVSVRPAQRLSYLVTADALGRWAYHCHLAYHMEAGMFREVVVAHEGAEMPEHHS